jgi:hypothetical protein
MSELYVVLKLTSGEQVMAVLKEEDEHHIIVENPMVMKTIQDFAEGKEHITAHPMCAFTDDTDFVLAKRNVLFIKKLHHLFIGHYERIVAEANDATIFQPHNREEDLVWEDEVVEEKEEEIDWNEKLKSFVKGNDTIN